jgi:hypothetical protein
VRNQSPTPSADGDALILVEADRDHHEPGFHAGNVSPGGRVTTAPIRVDRSSEFQTWIDVETVELPGGGFGTTWAARRW